MTTPAVASEVLVRAYLNGRSMDEAMFRAVVWMAGQRLRGSITPALNQALCQDIDSQAGAVRTIRWPWL